MIPQYSPLRHPIYNPIQVMAAFRNTAIGLARSAGKTNIAAACREFVARPILAMELIGIRI
jgi:hypothetical protein